MSSLSSISTDRPFLIGICGGSASGKTSVANIIFKYVGIEHCLLFSMDMYYKGPNPEERKHLNDYNFDHPDALDLDLLSTHLKMLMQNKSIDMPVYEFNGSYRTDKIIKVHPRHIIIFEGILAFHDKRLRDLMNLKIFVDLDGDLRLARRVYRDIKDRGGEIFTIIERYHKFVKPSFERFIQPTKKFADVVIPRGAENTPAIDLITQNVKGELIRFLAGKNDNIIENNIVLEKKLWSMEEVFNDKKASSYIGKVKICSESKRKILLKGFNDFINGKRLAYLSMYVEQMTKTLWKMIEKDFKQNEVHFLLESEIFLNAEVDKDAINNKNNVVLFFPILFECSSITKAFISSFAKDKKIIIATIVIGEEVVDELIKLNQNIVVYSVYFGDALKKNEQYIKKGGFISRDEGLITESIMPFNPSNFEMLFNLNKTLT